MTTIPTFANPPPPFRNKTFWAWNDRLEPAEIRRQVRLFSRMGFGGFLVVRLDIARRTDFKLWPSDRHTTVSIGWDY